MKPSLRNCRIWMKVEVLLKNHTIFRLPESKKSFYAKPFRKDLAKKPCIGRRLAMRKELCLSRGICYRESDFKQRS